MEKYFSENELGSKERVSENISISVWNGIVSIFEQFKTENYFSSDFPANCLDGLGIYGFDSELFQDRIKSEIPNIDIPIIRKEKVTTVLNNNDFTQKEIETKIDKYSVLDFIEFCHKYIKEPAQGSYHDFFKHYHLSFKNNPEIQGKFRKKINKIFERNGIVFFINENGEIERTIPKPMQLLIDKTFNTNDSRLNELVKLANDKFILPRIDDRIYALEIIWDAFERVKTYYGDNKRQSVEQLIELVANNNEALKNVISDEAFALKNIGNNFQIRHFETNKTEITDNKHIDYLFYRMISLINLFLSKLE